MNKFKKLIGSAFVVASGLVAAGANAAIDISAATADATSDVKAAGALIIGVVVAVAAISWIRRVIR